MIETRPLRFGVLGRSSQTTWPKLLDLAHRVEALGFDSLWTNHHLLPVVGRRDDDILEGWMTLAAWGQATHKVRVGLAVSCNTFRPPALLAKMVTTLDHISGGRAILGIGAGWYEAEHAAFGLDYGSGPSERLRWLREALPIIVGMLADSPPKASGRYLVDRPPNRPRSIQPRIPILIGGDGEKVTLRLVAQYGDACNLSPANDREGFQRKLRLIDRYCEAVGRDPAEIERTTELPMVAIRDSRAAALRLYRRVGGNLWTGRAPGPAVGPPEGLLDHLRSLVDLGFTHITFGLTAPYA
jgi:alkanesulfonate monooxygenase SsuD/methylene tetrahydromethanopterin reductase-like flavin-dependent oxidoreductase (luciferase family)